ncbi:hypothetical protein B0H66DRAFT_544897 [Apodospora peruviana]|uniref:Uncharacterized protein n=1 Tax=Apodospora peruviana TaxID=516989 RepID=A0AAE0IT48_9PEZI|nr:hypothetical protein B0H66DRAFT_544897 [Apodospora peruviana]
MKGWQLFLFISINLETKIAASWMIHTTDTPIFILTTCLALRSFLYVVVLFSFRLLERTFLSTRHGLFLSLNGLDLGLDTYDHTTTTITEGRARSRREGAGKNGREKREIQKE